MFCAVTGKLLGKLRAAGHDNAFQVLGVEFHQLFIILFLRLYHAINPKNNEH